MCINKEGSSIPVSWKELSPNQKNIVKDISGPVLVLAGPGTGKTEILSHKIAYLKKVGSGAEKDILAITFSRKASNEMKDRVTAFERLDVESIKISTLHSLALNILHKANIGRQYLASTDETIFIIKDAAEDVEGKKIEKKKALEYLNFINSLKNKGACYYNIGDEKLKHIYKRYEELLDFNKVQDLEGIVLRAVNVLSSGQSDIISSKYLLIDEYQDINKIEFKFIRQLAKDSKHIFVVGDDDQSIYGWRGSDPHIIVNFKQLFKGAEIYNLETSFRVPENILKGALQIVEKIGTRMKKVVNSIKKNGGKIKIVISDSAASESNWISKKISELSSDGVDPNEIAILAKELSLLDPIKCNLQERGIDYLYWGERNLFSDKNIQVLMAVLRVLNDKDDNLAIRTCIEDLNLFNIGPKKTKALRGAAEQNDSTLWHTLVNAEKNSVTQPWNKDYKKFVGFILSIENSTHDKSVTGVVTYVGEVLGIKNDQAFLDLVRMSEKRSFSGLKDFIESYYNEKSYNSERQRIAEEAVGKVNLMSIHSSKGLGYNVIFMIGLNQHMFPNPSQDCDEQRRLCYVGMTRSNQMLYMCHCQEIVGQSAHGYAKYHPSPFLQEIPDECYELIDLRH